MIKFATVTPVNCITHKQDGAPVDLMWDGEKQAIVAHFEDGREETLEPHAQTLVEAMDIAYALYAASNAYIYEQEEVEA